MTTTILNLPEEVLILIFEELRCTWISQCQYVCKAWYPTAHKMVLNHIVIPFTDIPKFIAAIDCNPTSAYLNAVQGIYIYDHNNGTQQCHSFDKEMIAKMFYRFPNLKKVSLEDSSITYDNFDDDTCKTILKSCPKLDTFQISRFRYVGGNRVDQDKETILKFRLLLTSINLEKLEFSTRLENSVDFLSKFPRLQAIPKVPDISNFQQLLPILAQLKNLKRIELDDAIGDQEGFAETYLASKPKDEQKQIIKALSAVGQLDVVCGNAIINENTIGFIAKYLTGLHSFSLRSYSLQNLQHVRLLNTIINLVCTSFDKGYFFSYVRRDDFKTCLPSIISNLYQNTSMEKAFTILIDNGRSHAEGFIYLVIKSYKPTRNMNMKPSALRNITTILPETKNAKRFIINVDECSQGYEQKLTARLYDTIYNTDSELQSVILEASPWYANDFSCAIRCTLIERVTLRVIRHSLSQAMLDQLTIKFPNLTELSLINVCKTWNHKQKLSLGHSLEKLSLDLSPSRYNRSSYITLQVSLTSINEEHLYKVTRSPEKMIGGRLYLTSELGHIHVILNDLQRLDVYTKQDGKLSPLTLFDKTK